MDEFLDDEDVGHYSEWRDKREELGCVMAKWCCMPGEHYPSECHDVAMIEAIEAEALASKGGERG